MSRKTKRIEKEKKEKEVLRDLRRFKELSKNLYEKIPLKKKKLIGYKTVLSLKKDVFIPKELRDDLNCLVEHLFNSFIVFKFESFFEPTFTISVYRLEKLPENLKNLFKKRELAYYKDIVFLKEPYIKFVETTSVPIYKEYQRVINGEILSEYEKLEKKLWYEKEAAKVLHEGKSSWEKIDKKYNRAKVKKDFEE